MVAHQQTESGPIAVQDFMDVEANFEGHMAKEDLSSLKLLLKSPLHCQAERLLEEQL